MTLQKWVHDPILGNAPHFLRELSQPKKGRERGRLAGGPSFGGLGLGTPGLSSLAVVRNASIAMWRKMRKALGCGSKRSTQHGP